MEATVDVTEPSQTAEVRRVVAEIGKMHGMAEIDLGRAALAATELSTNLVKYAKRGRIAVSWFEEGSSSGLQLIALDHGPGFENFQASARDGHSSGGSLGIGLGAIMRTADVFDMYSVEPAGSVFLARICVKAIKPRILAGSLLLGSRADPKLGQTECGDAWGYKQAGRWQRICVIDGLGHGPLAARASAEAVRVFNTCPEADTPVDILMKAHTALKSTRGAVMAVIAIDTLAGVAFFAGVGNIAGVIFGANKPQHLVSIDGTVGYNVRAFRQHEYAWGPDSTLVMNTDGFGSRWNLSKLPGLLRRHPALIAAVLHRDFSRDIDDSTVVVARSAN
jgi:anti-sigma regulatory factor (Ser/Thr protein kinase)